jgi:hypothetical protein
MRTLVGDATVRSRSGQRLFVSESSQLPRQLCFGGCHHCDPVIVVAATMRRRAGYFRQSDRGRVVIEEIPCGVGKSSQRLGAAR